MADQTFRKVIVMAEDEFDPLVIIGRLILSTVKAIFYIRTGTCTSLSQVWREKIVIHEDQAPPEPPTTPSSESQDD